MIRKWLRNPLGKMQSRIYNKHEIRRIFFFLIFVVSMILVLSFSLLLGLILFSVLVLVHPITIKLWDKMYSVRDIADHRFYAKTQDGWNISMHLHQPKSNQTDKYPVILSHGISMNKYGVDLDYSHSLAYYLKQHGYTVFVLSLRGAGDSYYGSLTSEYKDFCFDDIVENDVPAVIRRVRELTGSPKVNWIGHSLGAMIAQGFLGRQLAGHEDLACFISLGGLGRVDHLRDTFLGPLAHYPRIFRFLNFRFSAQLFSPLVARIYTPLDRMLYSRENIDINTIRKLSKNAMSNIAEGLALQLLSWLKSGLETTVDGRFDYRSGLQNIKLPFLCIAGASDVIASPKFVRFAYENVCSKHKKFVLLSKNNGYSVDYCHTALVMGEFLYQEVGPIVADWLEQYGLGRSKWRWKRQPSNERDYSKLRIASKAT